MPVLNGYITRRVTFAKGFGGTIKQWFCLLLKSCSINLERPLIRCACLPAPIPPVFLTFIFHKCSGKNHGHTDKPYSKLYYRDKKPQMEMSVGAQQTCTQRSNEGELSDGRQHLCFWFEIVTGQHEIVPECALSDNEERAFGRKTKALKVVIFLS